MEIRSGCEGQKSEKPKKVKSYLKILKMYFFKNTSKNMYILLFIYKIWLQLVNGKYFKKKHRFVLFKKCFFEKRAKKVNIDSKKFKKPLQKFSFNISDGIRLKKIFFDTLRFFLGHLTWNRPVVGWGTVTQPLHSQCILYSSSGLHKIIFFWWQYICN